MPDIANPVFDRHFHIDETDGARVAGLNSHLLLGGAERDASGVRVHNERRDALLDLAVDLDGHFCEDGEEARVTGVGDPDFFSVQQVVRAVGAEFGGGAHGLRVGTGAGFCEAERGNGLAGGALREPALLLIVGAKERDPLAADGLVRAEVDAERRVGGADFAEHAAKEHGAGAEAAVFLRNAKTHQPQFGHPLTDLVGELAVVVELGGIHGVSRPRAEGIEDGGEVFLFILRHLGKREDEIFADFAEKKALGERWVAIGICEMGGHRSVRCGGTTRTPLLGCPGRGTVYGM